MRARAPAPDATRSTPYRHVNDDARIPCHSMKPLNHDRVSALSYCGNTVRNPSSHSPSDARFALNTTQSPGSVHARNTRLAWPMSMLGNIPSRNTTRLGLPPASLPPSSASHQGDGPAFNSRSITPAWARHQRETRSWLVNARLGLTSTTKADSGRRPTRDKNRSSFCPPPHPSDTNAHGSDFRLKANSAVARS
jgi:hypothetical protein